MSADDIENCTELPYFKKPMAPGGTRTNARSNGHAQRNRLHREN